MVPIKCNLKSGVLMHVADFSEQTQKREGRGPGSEPTPWMPLVVCILAVGMAMALVQVNWASPLFGGTVLLVVVATLRNRVEEAQERASKEAPACQETPGPDEGQSEPPFQKPSRADRRFTGDALWGLN
jgi:hypothetical protein